MINFEDIYQTNYPTLYRTAQKMIADEQVVADIVQEVFITLYEKIEKGDKIIYLKSWLYRITLNKSIDYIKRNKRFENLHEQIEYTQNHSQVEHQETQQLVRRSLNKLPENERLLVILYSEGLSYKEMAEVTGIKFTSIGKTLSRLLRKLEKELKKQQHEVY